MAGLLGFEESLRLFTVVPVARRLTELAGWEICGADSLLRWAIPLHSDFGRSLFLEQGFGSIFVEIDPEILL